MQVKPRIAHMPMGCPREPPKTIGNPCVSACPPKVWILHFPSKSYTFSGTLIKHSKNEQFIVRSYANPSPVRSGQCLHNRIPRGHPSKTIGNPCVFEVPPIAIPLAATVPTIVIFNTIIVKYHTFSETHIKPSENERFCS